jgi:hypothetical protein
MNAQAIDLYETPAAYRAQLPSIWSQTYSVAQGQVAEASRVIANAALAHFAERPTIVLAFAESEDFTFEHIVLAPNRSVKTQYRHVGRLPPREYMIDE